MKITFFILMILIFFGLPLELNAQELGPDLASNSTSEIAKDEFFSDIAEGGLSERIIQIFLMITVLSLAPGIAMMITCLPFMVIVFSFLRQAIGLQQTPPNMMVMSLAMFLTFFVMEPVFSTSWADGVKPYMDGELTQGQALENTIEPFRDFMNKRVEPETVSRLAASIPERQYDLSEKTALPLLITAFMLSEIKHAFQIGFVIFLPFLIIDLIIASVLMAMGMMMLPPVIVSLPFKLAFFVMADGWIKITEALLQGYG